MAETVTVTVRLDETEWTTIRAALAYYREGGQGEPEARTDRVHDIATNGDSQISLNAEGINDLILKLEKDAPFAVIESATVSHDEGYDEED